MPKITKEKPEETRMRMVKGVHFLARINPRRYRIGYNSNGTLLLGQRISAAYDIYGDFVRIGKHETVII